MRRLNIAVVFGGRSAEHEVSLASAAFVAATLARRHRVLPLGLTRRGEWRLGVPGRPFSPAAVLRRGRRARLVFGPGRAALAPAAGGRPLPVDVFFPVLHGPGGEDGSFQGLCELAGWPYAGCGVFASAAGMDKEAARLLFAAHGLPVVKSLVLEVPAAGAGWAALAAKCARALPGPVFVKPARLGSSVGISRTENARQLARALREAGEYDTKILVERAVPRAREIECAVLGAEGERPRVSVCGEILPSRKFYDYRAKYLDRGSRLLIPAPLPAALARRLRQAASEAFCALGGGGMARVDFLLEGGGSRFYVNEANTIPGFTPISMYPKLWQASGLAPEALLEQLLRLALARHERRGALRCRPREGAGNGR